MQENDEGFNSAVLNASTKYEEVRHAFDWLLEIEPTALLMILQKAFAELRIKEQLRNHERLKFDMSSASNDLYSRRCDLAVAICRNDEQGLTSEKLDLIAAIIWPAPIPEASEEHNPQPQPV